MGKDKIEIRGVVTPLVTPLTTDGDLDEAALQSLVDKQIEAGINGLFILGSAGEGPLLSQELCDLTAKRSVEFVNGRLPIYGGVSDNSVSRCLQRLERLAMRGVSAGVATLPFYGWSGNEDNAIEFYSKIAGNSPIPLVAYNLPKVAGRSMSMAVIEKLFEIPNLVCLKETTDDLESMSAVAGSPKRPKNFYYLPGNIKFSAPLLESGADGFVPASANLFPQPFVNLYRLHLEGKRQDVRALDRDVIQKMARLASLLPSTPASIKCAMEIMGLCSRQTVRPWPVASEADMTSMKSILDEVEEALSEV